MKKLLTVLCFMFAITPVAFAQDKGKDADKSTSAKKEPTEKQKAQQARMRDCSEKAGDRKGDDRKKFMSSCLKGEAPAKSDQSAKKTAQQEKMASCNKEAKEKNMKGDDRKKFMKECLSK
jgi:hypothetical protein